jgi:hypothetical protein
VYVSWSSSSTYGGDSGNRIFVLYWRCSLIRVSVIRGSSVFSIFRLLIFLNLCPSLPFIYCFCSLFKIELNLSLCLVMNQAAETNTREEVQLQLFLTSPVGSGECLA